LLHHGLFLRSLASSDNADGSVSLSVSDVDDRFGVGDTVVVVTEVSNLIVVLFVGIRAIAIFVAAIEPFGLRAAAAVPSDYNFK